MAIFDIIIILVFVIVAVFGYRYGVFKMISDVITLFISSILSKLISNVLFNLLYQYLPFFNFFGKTKGLKSINIIVWQLIIYVIILLVIIMIINKILKKTKLNQKISDSMVEANLISKILGVIVSILLSFVITFNGLLLILIPCFNLTSIMDSRFATIIMEKMPTLSSQNNALYKSETYTIERINKKDNTDAKFKNVNNDIVKYMVKADLISNDKVKVLNKKDKLVGKRKTVADEIIEETDLTKPTNDKN